MVVVVFISTVFFYTRIVVKNVNSSCVCDYSIRVTYVDVNMVLLRVEVLSCSNDGSVRVIAIALFRYIRGVVSAFLL